MEQILAHIYKDEFGKTIEQPLTEHLEKVATYARETVKGLNLEKTATMLGRFHDLGKSKQGFQEYIRKVTSGENEEVNRVVHSSTGAIFIDRIVTEKFSGEDKGSTDLIRDILAYPILAHHGLMDCIARENGKPIDHFSKRMEEEDDISNDGIKTIAAIEAGDSDSKADIITEAYHEVEQTIENLILLSHEEISKEKSRSSLQIENSPVGEMLRCRHRQSFFAHCGLLIRLLLSALIDADWRETSEFYSGELEKRFSKEERSLLWTGLTKRLDERLKDFSQTTTLAQTRSRISDACFDFVDKGRGIYRLSVPTGGGKTFASLRYALAYAKRYSVDHVFYVAPYLSILEQNAQVIRQTLMADDYILEHHSNVVFDDTELTPRSRLYTENWDAPIILTTMVQFFNTLASGKSSSVRRFHQLKNSVIIIDEVQNIPLHCLYYFDSAINFLSRICRTTVILCSATQPCLDNLTFRMRLGNPPDLVTNCSYEVFKRVRFNIEHWEETMQLDDLIVFAQEHIRNNMLIVLNTKRAVRQVSEALNRAMGDRYRIIQLTTYMCAQERLDIINELQRALPKEKMICVSTNLIEAGVDLSFESGIRSLAGIDNIVQTGGRINRNGEMKSGDLYIVALDKELENTSPLQELRNAVEATKILLRKPIYKDMDRSDINIDMLVPEYYKSLHQKYDDGNNKKMMEYYERLATNKPDLEDYKTVHGREYSHQIAQAFKSTGEDFSYIQKQKQVSIFVPYKQGKEHIEDLKRCRTLGDERRILKRMQRYIVTVTINDQQLRLLQERGLLEMWKPGIYILGSGQYRTGVGVVAEMETFIL